MGKKIEHIDFSIHSTYSYFLFLSIISHLKVDFLLSWLTSIRATFCSIFPYQEVSQYVHSFLHSLQVSHPP